MSLRKTLFLFFTGWLIVISALHARLNPDSVRDFRELVASLRRDKTVVTTDKFKIGFLPVTCHLTCPVTDFINQQLTGGSTFQPIRFNSWPELKESYLAGHTPATFILAPMAIALREQGVPIKIVYLGHRDGTAVMVHKDSQIFRMEDLRGKRVAVPNRYSNQRLLFFRALKLANMTIADIQLVEMPPPDMPAALYSKSVDAICSGEPFMGQTELDGYGRVLWLTKDVWPNFISCVLAVRDDVIQTRRTDVQALVDGIAKSGKWLDKSMDHRMSAAQFVSKNYYMQDPRLLIFVLSKPPDRVKYTRLTPLKPDFEEIEMLGKESGILKGTAHFEDYVDPTFADAATEHADAWNFEGPKP
ncbi:MAG: ABC transporter substrate-binding protein [Chthoniobacter sp.]|uniref:ABC transporter substrate-binding protein n=1 Tax=Chthoniobacter sp. TaxID=2510640 RepID=UPI0032A7D44B